MRIINYILLVLVTVLWAGVQLASAEETPNDAIETSAIHIENLVENSVVYVISFYTQDGTHVAHNAGMIEPFDTVEIIIEDVDDIPSGFIGSAIISANQPVAASMTLSDGETVKNFSLPTTGITAQQLNVKKMADIVTRLMIQNTTSQAILIHLNYVDPTRSTACVTSHEIAALGVLEVDIEGTTCLADGYDGTVNITSATARAAFVATAFDITPSTGLFYTFVSAVRLTWLSARPFSIPITGVAFVSMIFITVKVVFSMHTSKSSDASTRQ